MFYIRRSLPMLYDSTFAFHRALIPRCEKTGLDRIDLITQHRLPTRCRKYQRSRMSRTETSMSHLECTAHHGVLTASPAEMAESSALRHLGSDHLWQTFC